MGKEEVSVDQSTKNRRGIFITIIALVVFLSASYFAYRYYFLNKSSGDLFATTTTPFNKPDGDSFSTNTTPLNVIPTLGADTATLVVNIKGGEIRLSDETTITFPAKSVLGSQVVTASKLESIGNLPTGYELVSGIELSPSTLLGAAAKISLPLPAGTDTTKLIGFEYTEGGTDFFLTPLKIVGQTAELTINGFSGHGVISIGDSSQLPPNPSTIEKQANQFIGNIVRSKESLIDKESLKESLTDNELSRIQNLLTGWFNTSVSPRLKAATGADDASVDGAIHEFMSWLVMVQMFGLDDELQAETNKGFDLTAEALKSASDKAYASCVNNKDPAAATRLFRWYALTELMPFDRRKDISAQTIFNHAKQCVNFELRITSEFINDQGQKSTASGSVLLSIDDDLIISGEGKIEQTSFQVNDSSGPCTAAAPVIFPIKVPGVGFDAYAEVPGVSVLFELGESENKPSYDCPFGYQHLTLHGHYFSWVYDFYDAHESERIGDLGYLVKDFAIFGSGGTYAKKIYSGTTGDLSEQTTFELLHHPK